MAKKPTYVPKSTAQLVEDVQESLRLAAQQLNAIDLRTMPPGASREVIKALRQSVPGDRERLELVK